MLLRICLLLCLAGSLLAWDGGFPGSGAGGAGSGSFASGIATTTDATPVAVVTVPLTTDRAYWVKARVIGRQTTGATDSAVYEIVGHAENVAGTASVVQQSPFTSEEDSGWNAVLVATGASVQVLVTGDGTEDVNWFVEVEVLEGN